MMRTELEGKTLLVTGGGSGIGKLLAIGAAQRGARVVIWDLDGDSAGEVRDEILALGADCESFAVDVADPRQVSATASRTGEVDVVINNAGVVSGSSLMDLSEDQIERTFRINVLGLYWVTRAFLPAMMKKRSGTVVTIASAAGLVGVSKQTDYSASKFAAVGFAESLRMEMRKQKTGVTSLVVCPYYIDTGMFEGVTTKFPLLLPIMQPQYVANKILDSIESGRQQLIMPRFARLLPVVRALPIRAFDAVVDFFGINQTMDDFVGRAETTKK